MAGTRNGSEHCYIKKKSQSVTMLQDANVQIGAKPVRIVSSTSIALSRDIVTRLQPEQCSYCRAGSSQTEETHFLA